MLVKCDVRKRAQSAQTMTVTRGRAQYRTDKGPKQRKFALAATAPRNPTPKQSERELGRPRSRNIQWGPQRKTGRRRKKSEHGLGSAPPRSSSSVGWGAPTNDGATPQEVRAWVGASTAPKQLECGLGSPHSNIE